MNWPRGAALMPFEHCCESDAADVWPISVKLHAKPLRINDRSVIVECVGIEPGGRGGARVDGDTDTHQRCDEWSVGDGRDIRDGSGWCQLTGKVGILASAFPSRATLAQLARSSNSKWAWLAIDQTSVSLQSWTRLASFRASWRIPHPRVFQLATELISVWTDWRKVDLNARVIEPESIDLRTMDINYFNLAMRKKIGSLFPGRQEATHSSALVAPSIHNMRTDVNESNNTALVRHAVKVSKLSATDARKSIAPYQLARKWWRWAGAGLALGWRQAALGVTEQHRAPVQWFVLFHPFRCALITQSVATADTIGATSASARPHFPQKKSQKERKRYRYRKSEREKKDD